MLTTKQLSNIVSMYREGISTLDIAKQIGVSRAAIYYALRKADEPRVYRSHPPVNTYRVYDKHGHLLIQGSAAECADFLCIARNTFYTHIRRPGKSIRVELVESPSVE